MSFIQKLNERYAAKAMNGQVVPAEKIDNILILAAETLLKALS